jgi:antirestriction protein ArdC
MVPFGKQQEIFARSSALYLNSPAEYRAYTRASINSVHMPARSRFVEARQYYSTLFH